MRKTNTLGRWLWILAVLVTHSIASSNGPPPIIYWVLLPAPQGELAFRQITWATTSNNSAGINFSKGLIILDDQIDETCFLKEEEASRMAKAAQLVMSLNKKGTFEIKSTVPMEGRLAAVYRKKTWCTLDFKPHNNGARAKLEAQEGDLVLVVLKMGCLSDITELGCNFSDEKAFLEDLSLKLSSGTVMAVLLTIHTKSDERQSIVPMASLKTHFCIQRWFLQFNTLTWKHKVDASQKELIPGNLGFSYLGLPPLLDTMQITIKSQRYSFILMTIMARISEVGLTEDKENSLTLMVFKDTLKVFLRGQVPYTVAVYRGTSLTGHNMVEVFEIPIELGDVVVLLPHLLTWKGHHKFSLFLPEAPLPFNFENPSGDFFKDILSGREALMIKIVERTAPVVERLANLQLKKSVLKPNKQKSKLSRSKNKKNIPSFRIYSQPIPTLTGRRDFDQITWCTSRKEYPAAILFNEHVVYFGQEFIKTTTSYLSKKIECVMDSSFKLAKAWAIKIISHHNIITIESRLCLALVKIVRGGERLKVEYASEQSELALSFKVEPGDLLEIIPYIGQLPKLNLKHAPLEPKLMLKKIAKRNSTRPISGIVIKIGQSDEMVTSKASKEPPSRLIIRNLTILNWYKHPHNNPHIDADSSSGKPLLGNWALQWTSDHCLVRSTLTVSFALFGVALDYRTFKISNQLRGGSINPKLPLRELILQLFEDTLTVTASGSLPFAVFLLRADKVMILEAGCFEPRTYQVLLDDTIIIMLQTLQGQRLTMDSFKLIQNRESLIKRLKAFTNITYLVAKVAPIHQMTRSNTSPLSETSIISWRLDRLEEDVTNAN